MKVESSFNNINKILAGQMQSSKSSQIPLDETLKAQENGYSKAIDNIQSSIDLGKTAEGALNSVNDNLQSIRDLAIQAKNGALTDGDKAIIQDQINQLKEGIGETIKNTEFNTIKLLDGGYNGNVQTGPNAGGSQVMRIENTSLETLGIKDFDVTKDFDIDTIDSALEKITSSRSNIGATTNRLETAVSVNETTRENLMSARSTMQEDIVNQITNLKKNQILDQFKNQMDMQKVNSQRGTLSILG